MIDQKCLYKGEK